MNKLIVGVSLLALSLQAQDPRFASPGIRMDDVSAYIKTQRLPKKAETDPFTPAPTPKPEPRLIFCSSCRPGPEVGHAFSDGELGAQLNSEKPLVYFYGQRPPVKLGYDVIPIVEEAPIFVSSTRSTKAISRDQLDAVMNGAILDWHQLGDSGHGTIRIYVDHDPVAVHKITRLLKTIGIKFDENRPGIQWSSQNTLEDAAAGDPNALVFGMKRSAAGLRPVQFIPSAMGKNARQKLELPMYLYIKEDAKVELKQSALNNIASGENALKEVLKDSK